MLNQLGPCDVGQSVAIQEGLVLAVEAIEGTDQMIERAGSLKRDVSGPILIKMSADQDKKLTFQQLRIQLKMQSKQVSEGWRLRPINY